MDDSFFSVCFSVDNKRTRAAAQEIINGLLERNDLIIEFVQSQVTEQIFGSKGIRLDMLAVDSRKRRINLEIQKWEGGFSAERLRVYLAYQVIRSIRKGDPYDQLKESFLIFLCDFDPFEKGEVIYPVNLMIAGQIHNAGQNALIINGPKLKEEESQRGRIALDFYESDPEKLGSAILQKLVSEIKNNRNYQEEIMTITERLRLESYEEGERRGIEKGIKKGIEKGIKKRDKQFVCNATKSGLELGMICQLTGLSEEEVLELQNS